MLQQFVRTADFDKVYAVVNEVMAKADDMEIEGV
jgi:hypothetical protein